MYLTRRLTLATAAFLAPRAHAQSRPLRIIVPFPPGGAVDLTARVIGQAMGEALGATVVVENRPGANGIIGAEAVARAAPDGGTLLLAPREVFGINPVLTRTLPYDAQDGFAFIGIATTGHYLMVVNPALGAADLGALVALAHQRELAYGSFGIGSMPHLNLEGFSRALGIRMTHVPYRGAAPAVQAVLANEVALAVATPPSVLELVRNGRLRALVVGAPRRLPQLPEVPTLAEAGIAPELLLPNFFGLAAPAGTPSMVVARLNAAMATAVTQSAVGERLLAAGLWPAPGSPEAMRAIVARDIVRFGDLITIAGIERQ
jgi:tripartite-type tricarboxylate transporter receptor subunit TctC